jgi:3-oxoacyl-[acyl-carrier protein] reductase
VSAANPVEPPTRRFGGTVSLVTGAGGGIGSATAERLAGEGSQVIVCDADAAAATTVATRISDRGGTATVLAFDLTDPAACAAGVASAARQVADELGHRVHLVQGDLTDPAASDAIWTEALRPTSRIDVLVNNAGAWIALGAADAHL